MRAIPCRKHCASLRRPREDQGGPQGRTVLSEGAASTSMQEVRKHQFGAESGEEGKKGGEEGAALVTSHGWPQKVTMKDIITVSL